MKFVSGLTMYESHPNPRKDILDNLTQKVKDLESKKKNLIDKQFVKKNNNNNRISSMRVSNLQGQKKVSNILNNINNETNDHVDNCYDTVISGNKVKVSVKEKLN